MMPAVLWPNGSASIPRVTSEYNAARKNPVTGIIQPHDGIDLVGWSVIVAPTDGLVTFAGYNGGAGNEVRIRADGPNAFVKGDVYRLMHNRELWVRAGTRVTQGQGVAVMGTTGNSTGVHCHFETRPGGGAALNPRQYMASRNAGTTGGGSTPSPSEEDEMSARAEQQIEAVYAGFFGPANVINPATGKPASEVTTWAKPFGEKGGSAYYGIFDVILSMQAQIASLVARPATAVTAEQVKAIADAVVKAVGKPTITLDYAAIAKAVNDDAARRLAG